MCLQFGRLNRRQSGDVPGGVTDGVTGDRVTGVTGDGVGGETGEGVGSVQNKGAPEKAGDSSKD